MDEEYCRHLVSLFAPTFGFTERAVEDKIAEISSSVFRLADIILANFCNVQE